MRRAHRQDANHNAIKEEFKRLGCTWMDTYQLGRGLPDGIVGYGGLCMAIEIKDAAKIPSQRKLTPMEQEFHSYWTGGMRIVETKADCMEVFTVMEGWHNKLRL